MTIEKLILISMLAVLVHQGTCQSNAFKEPASISLHKFAYDVYTRTATASGENKNFVISPISLFSVLTLLTPGLKGNSLHQVLNALRMTDFSDPEKMESNMCSKIFSNNSMARIYRANRIFVDLSVTLIKKYKATLKKNHKVAVKRVDFAGRSNSSRSRINRFVYHHTNKEIKSLIPPSFRFDPLTKIVLVNAVSLKAAWMTSFTLMKKETTFNMTPQTSVQVQMMKASQSRCMIDFIPELRSTIIVLPFKETELTMTIVMPQAAGDFSAVDSRRSGEIIKDFMDEVWLYNQPPMGMCNVRMPRFAVRHSLNTLKGILQAMGVTDIFSASLADFSGMTTVRDIRVTDIFHEAVVKVNEKGIKASAASAIVIGGRMSASEVLISKPFMFFIRHEDTGAVLFSGKIVKPEYGD